MIHRRREARARRRLHRQELRRARRTALAAPRETRSRSLVMQRAFKGVVTARMSRVLNGLARARWARHAAATRAQNRSEPFDPADLLPIYRHPQERRTARLRRQEEGAV